MMSEATVPVRKLTVSLPARLADFLDREALRLNVSRSKLVADALREVQAAEEERRAIEGYRFYAHEASDFAQASIGAMAEVLDHAG
jgi:metal-responsive CopG/Arc/MetJ family transcriptional regulator